MTKIAVTGIIEHNGQVLVGKKIKKDGHFLSEKWHIPGGGIEENETDENALIREMQEEAGIKVKVVKFLDTHSYNGTLIKWYICEPLTFELKPGDDLEEVKFVAKEDVIKVCDKEAISRWPSKVRAYLTAT